MNDIAAVIPVRNGERFLRDAVESILEQRPSPAELIIVDDGSEDETRALAQSLPGVTCVESTTGLGPAAARNLGVRLAKSDFVAFLDADDRWLPGKLAAYRLALEASGAALGFGHVRYVLRQQKFVPHGFDARLLIGEHVGKFASTLVASRELLLQHPFDETFMTAEDVEWFSRLARLSVPHQVVPGCWLEKSVHDENLSLTHPAGRADLFRALRKHLHTRRDERRHTPDGPEVPS